MMFDIILRILWDSIEYTRFMTGSLSPVSVRVNILVGSECNDQKYDRIRTGAGK